ncbi:hypothetical protein [Arthrobacter sp. ISL-95]|uniref:hypothetical protein n=1 Tax=Arthrobacter sp. ISL-95 TaxID=2819116 RepID=UPI001BEB97BA|nr:hypothetical protein [Arthrobacter sp. ISL-95]MBT2584958.1 hypothetical protein [Arthrobacter sp. ISL-95]
MDKPESSAAATAAFEGLGADLASAGVLMGKMFGARSLMLSNKALACLNGDKVVFKLGRDSQAFALALALPGASLFDPSGMNRPYKDWVEVPFTSQQKWPALAEAALRFVAGGSSD